MCTFSCSTKSAFVWVGAVLFNVCILLWIHWAVHHAVWPVGLTLSLLYTIGLFGVARYLDNTRCSRNETITPAEEHESALLQQSLLGDDVAADETNQPDADAEQQQQQQQSSPEAEEEEAAAIDTSERYQRQAPGTSVVVSLIYVLAVVSLGVTSYMVPSHVFPDCSSSNDDDNDKWRPRWKWTTNNDNNASTNIPQELHDWATRPIDYRQGASFGYIVDADTTLFSGSSLAKPYDPCLWTVVAAHNHNNASSRPIEHRDHAFPEQFLALDNTTVCFQSLHNTSTRNNVVSASDISVQAFSSVTKEMIIFCTSNGVDFRSVDITASHAWKQSHGHAADFMVDKNNTLLLWFKKFASHSQETGHLVYSLNVTSMQVMLHSQRVENDDHKSDNDCQPTRQIRHRALLALLVTALPVTAVSLRLWIIRQVPVMGLTTYLGLTLVFGVAYASMDPWSFTYDQLPLIPLEWWFTVSGLVYILVLSVLSIYYHEGSSSATTTAVNVTRPRHNDVYRWGIIVGGIALMGGMTALLLLDNDDGENEDDDQYDNTSNNNELGRLLVLNFLTFLPLILFGSATGTRFLVVQGTLGLVMDAWRLSTYVGDHINGSVSVPIQFLVFIVSSLVVVGGLGKLLGSSRQYRFQVWSQRQLQGIVDRIIRTRNNNDDDRLAGAAGGQDTSSLQEPLLSNNGQQEDNDSSREDDPRQLLEPNDDENNPSP